MSSDQGNPDQGRNTDATNGPDANPTDTNAQGNNQNSENNHRRTRNGRRNNSDRRNAPSKRNESKFKGATEGLNGHVFELPSEKPPRGQFLRTLEEFDVYTAREYKEEVGFLGKMFKNLETPEIDEPIDPGEDASRIQQIRFTESVKRWQKETRALELLSMSLFKVIWGQCSSLMQEKLESLDNYEALEEDGDCA